MHKVLETKDMGIAARTEKELEPGDYLFKVVVERPLSWGEIAALEAGLSAGGIMMISPIAQKSGNPSEIYIQVHKPAVEEGVGIAWALIIPFLTALIVPALIAVGIFKIEDISKSLVPLLLVVGGITIVLAALLREPATKYLGRR